MMHFVYMLQSEKDKKQIYIGNTGHLEKRLSEHNNGNNYSTKKYRPFRLIYYEAFLDKQDAVNREKKLKHHGSVIGHLRRRVKRSLTV